MVDQGSLVDLGKYGAMTPCRVCVLFARLWMGVLTCLARVLCACCGCCQCRRRRRKKATRAMLDPAAGLLGQESESDLEEEDEFTCQAVKIGLACGDEVKPLAPDGCKDITQRKTQHYCMRTPKSQTLHYHKEELVALCRWSCARTMMLCA